MAAILGVLPQHWCGGDYNDGLRQAAHVWPQLLPIAPTFAMTSDSRSSTLVAIATYNEIGNLPSLVSAIREQLPTTDVLVLDDNSPDGTSAWCAEFAAEHPWFSFIVREGKLGLGSAIVRCMDTAIERRYAYMVTMDADWSHPPRFLPALVEASGDADVVIGSRYCAGGGIENWTWSRRLASSAINSAARLALGVSMRDCSGNYRVYSTRVLERLNFDAIESTGFGFQEEILSHLARLGATFVEVPLVFADRLSGETKLDAGEAVAALRMLARLGLRRAAGKFRPAADTTPGAVRF